MIFIEGCSKSEGRTAEPSVLPKFRRSDTGSATEGSGNASLNRRRSSASGRRAYDDANRIVRMGWQVGVVGIAVAEMAKWREDVLAVTAADGADYVTRLACSGIEAFHES